MAASQTRRGSQAADIESDIAEEEKYYVTRPHTSVRRYRQPVQQDTLDDYAPQQTTFIERRRAIASKAVDPAARTARRGPRRRGPWVAIVLGMLAMLALFAGFNAFGSWWQLHQNDATYGWPRTYQTDAVVGHQDSTQKPSHFIFMNLNSRVIIIEFPGGDSTHAMIYSGPTLFGSGGDLIPVTGEFRDVNGDGRPDLIVQVQNQTIVFINTGTKFRPLQPGEHVNL